MYGCSVNLQGNMPLTILKMSLNDRLNACSYHITYVFQNESTLYSCLNVKELLARTPCSSCKCQGTPCSSCSHLMTETLFTNLGSDIQQNNCF